MRCFALEVPVDERSHGRRSEKWIESTGCYRVDCTSDLYVAAQHSVERVIGSWHGGVRHPRAAGLLAAATVLPGAAETKSPVARTRRDAAAGCWPEFSRCAATSAVS
jgi:hypothetical protein